MSIPKLILGEVDMHDYGEYEENNDPLICADLLINTMVNLRETSK